MLQRPQEVVTYPQPVTNRRARTRQWLARPRLWDDVFTRTVANLLSALVLTLLALSLGIFSLSRETWANVIFYTFALVGVVVASLAPWEGHIGRIKAGKATRLVNWLTGFLIGCVLIMAGVVLGYLLGSWVSTSDPFDPAGFGNVS